MNTTARGQIVEAEPERRFLRDAEQRLVRTKRKAISYISLTVVVVAIALFVTKDSPKRQANPMTFPLPFITLGLLMAAKQGMNIAKARQYVESSRKALADAEAGVVYTDNFCG